MLAVLVTTIIVIEFLVDSKINTAPPPTVVYADSWSVEPHGCGDRRPAEGRPGEEGRRREREAAAIPETGKAAGNVSAARGTPDAKFMAEALRLGESARGRSAPNPNVGCVIVSAKGEIVGRGATAAGGRPHAEAIALEQAGGKAKGSTVYVTLEPCAHQSPRGPACTDLLIEARPARVVIALKDPDLRTSGKGIRRLRDAGIEVKLGVGRKAAAESLAGWLTRLEARPATRHAEVGVVDRRKDRAAFGREQMDHRRGCAQARPSGARAFGHDPRRPRHLSGGRAAARRATAGAGRLVAAPGAADSRREGRRMGNPAISGGCVPAS